MYAMKTIIRSSACAAAVLLLAGVSCSKDHTYDSRLLYPNALVTVKMLPDSRHPVLQLDDRTVLYPVNLEKYGNREVRALINFREAKDSEIPLAMTAERQAVFVHWIDSILTKGTVPDLGEENRETYGRDPVEIVNSWETVVEDGYLTLRFRTWWGQGVTHYVNLVVGSDPEDPYKVVFYHDARDDFRGRMGDGLVAFRLSDLPDTGGEEVELTLEWTSFSGTKTTRFKYCTRP